MLYQILLIIHFTYDYQILLNWYQVWNHADQTITLTLLLLPCEPEHYLVKHKKLLSIYHSISPLIATHPHPYLPHKFIFFKTIHFSRIPLSHWILIPCTVTTCSFEKFPSINYPNEPQARNNPKNPCRTRFCSTSLSRTCMNFTGLVVKALKMSTQDITFFSQSAHQIRSILGHSRTCVPQRFLRGPLLILKNCFSRVFFFCKMALTRSWLVHPRTCVPQESLLGPPLIAKK